MNSFRTSSKIESNFKIRSSTTTKIKDLKNKSIIKEERNKKKMFKNLKTDIRKNQLKVKGILDDLIRIRHNNDADLKRKGFIIQSIKRKYIRNK